MRCHSTCWFRMPILDVADAWSEHLASADQPTWNLPPLVLSARQTLTGKA